jgi:hypothetical protein
LTHSTHLRQARAPKSLDDDGRGVLPALAQWPSLQAVLAVETIRMAHKQAPVTSDYRFYRARLGRSTTTFVTMIRQPWDIENKWHWSLDVTFNRPLAKVI